MIHSETWPIKAVPFPGSRESSLVNIPYPSMGMERLTTGEYAPHGTPSFVGTAESLTSSDTSTDATSTDSHGWEGKACEGEEQSPMLRCPVIKEFEQARAHHPVLASTGCTKQFCQAGRALHTDEPRVGENRALEVVEKEAEGFLRELHQEGYFDSDETFRSRLRCAITEIRTGASVGIVRETKQSGPIGGIWHQTSAELEWGIRRAWRNARKCIMRSHSDELM